MVILGTWKKRSLTLSIKANNLTISLQADDGAQVYSYDGEGRLWTAMRAGISYRRGLNGRVVAKWGARSGIRDRRWLSAEEARLLEEDARSMAADLINALRNGDVDLETSLDHASWTLLSRASAFDAQRYLADVAAYHRVYKPIGILPPDQYMAVVLQATEGCSFNTCTFCTFYRDRPFRIKTPLELGQHIQAVTGYLGAGMSLRRTIFLGDANALVTPMQRLLPMLEQVNRELDVERLGGIYAFLDGFSGDKKSRSDYEQLRQHGVRRVYIGMESGNDDLLRFLKKPGSASDAIQAVQTIKSAGIAVGVIFLLGAGGRAFSDRHVADTVQAITRMDLDLDDIIYFSELIESEGMPYVRDAYQAGLQPLSPAERIIQGEQIERRLHFSQAGGTPHISRYDIREFVY